MIFFRIIFIFLISAIVATAETVIHIAGSQSKSEGQLLEMLGGRLVHVEDNPATSWRADDAAFLLKQLMIKDGYPQVEVGWKVNGPNSILLTVKEGGRVSLGKVTITGAPTDDNGRLEKLFKSPAEKGRPLAIGPPPFREEDVGIGLSYIRQELNAAGYWAADATISKRNQDSVTGVVDLSINVVPGSIFVIGTPNVMSTDGQGVEETRAAVKPYIGKRAKTATLNAMRLAVEVAFNSKGYPDAKISMGETLNSPRYIPEINLNIGKRVKLRELKIEGLEYSNPKRITKRLEKMKGDWYDQAAMNKYLRSLLATGAFSTARVETNVVDDGMIDATLHLTEAKAKEVTLSAGFGTYQGAITRLAYADRNLFGELLGFSSGFEFSSRGVLGETKLVDPWLFGSDVTGTARLYALIYSREGYSTLESGLEGKISRKFGDHYTIDVLAGTSVVNATSHGMNSADLGDTAYAHPRLRITQSIDYRDSPVLPSRGWHLEAPLEIGAAIGNLSTSYAQAGLTGGWYHKIDKNYQVGVGGELGVIIPSGNGAELPIDLRYFNGGARSVRSFQERELGPKSADGYPIGGQAMWNTKVELIRSVSGPVSVVAFMDAGSLSAHYDELTSAEIEVAAGLGLRLKLPIGPVRLEYGYNLTRQSGDPVGTLHFAIGTAF
jgi:outer membrane protein insertion porin family